MKRGICVPEVPASQMVLTIITDEQLEAFADAFVKKYQQSVQPRSTAGKSPAEEWMTRRDCYKFWLRRHAGKDYPSYSALIDDMLDKVLALDKDAKAFVSEHGNLF